MRVKPANPSAIIRDPNTRQQLPPQGGEVPDDSNFWQRRLADGDVVQIPDEYPPGSPPQTPSTPPPTVEQQQDDEKARQHNDEAQRKRQQEIDEQQRQEREVVQRDREQADAKARAAANAAAGTTAPTTAATPATTTHEAGDAPKRSHDGDHKRSGHEPVAPLNTRKGG